VAVGNGFAWPPRCVLRWKLGLFTVRVLASVLTRVFQMGGGSKRWRVKFATLFFSFFKKNILYIYIYIHVGKIC